MTNDMPEQHNKDLSGIDKSNLDVPAESKVNFEQKNEDKSWPPPPSDRYEPLIPSRTLGWKSSVETLVEAIFGGSSGVVIAAFLCFCLLRILPHNQRTNFPNPWLFLLPIPLYAVLTIFTIRRSKVGAFVFLIASIGTNLVLTLLIFVLETLNFVN